MKKLTRTEANFENLLEAAILLEGHCRHAEHGCSCRGCDECEENYMAGQKKGLTLGELIDRELGPEVGDRYEYEGEDPYEDDRPDEENDEILNTFSQAMEIATKAPDPGLFKRMNPFGSARVPKLAAAADKIADATSVIADRFAKAARKL